jgi:hypothetical protein
MLRPLSCLGLSSLCAFLRAAGVFFRPGALLGTGGLVVALGCGRVETEQAPRVGPEPAPDESIDDEPVDDIEPLPVEDEEELECEVEGEVRTASILEIPAAIREYEHDEPIYTTGGLTGEPLTSEVTLPIALGTEAPNSVLLQLGYVFDLSCGEPSGEFTINDMEVLEGSARVTETDDAGVVIVEVEEAGDSRVHISGSLALAAGGNCNEEALDVPIDYTLLVHAEEFEWSVELKETCPAQIASGRLLPLDVRARDSEGQVQNPRNISAPALILSAKGDVSLKTPEGFSDSLTTTAPVGAGTVTVSLADGSSSVEVRVLPPEELEDVFLDYSLSGIVSRGDLPLEDGGSYTYVGQEPKLNVYARWVVSEGEALCGAPDAGHYWIKSLTPEVCPVGSRTCQPQEGSVFGSLLYEAIPIIANGTCTLQIEAPDFAGGSGLRHEFSVQLEDLDL